MDPKITARRVTVIKVDHTLTIDWDDGHKTGSTAYPLLPLL